jgi:hypothetical protein
VAHGVQAHHVGGAEGAGLGAAQLGAGQVVDHVDRQAELLGFVMVARMPNTPTRLAMKFGCPWRAPRPCPASWSGRLPAGRGFRLGRLGRDQFDQVHVARRVEEVHAAEARLQAGIETFGQL